MACPASSPVCDEVCDTFYWTHDPCIPGVRSLVEFATNASGNNWWPYLQPNANIKVRKITLDQRLLPWSGGTMFCNSSVRHGALDRNKFLRFSLCPTPSSSPFTKICIQRYRQKQKGKERLANGQAFARGPEREVSHRFPITLESVQKYST